MQGELCGESGQRREQPGPGTHPQWTEQPASSLSDSGPVCSTGGWSASKFFVIEL